MANYHSEYFWLFMAMGAFAGIVVFSLVKRIICRIMKIGKSHFNLEKVILWISFVGAVMCLVLSLLGEQTFVSPPFSDSAVFEN